MIESVNHSVDLFCQHIVGPTDSRCLIPMHRFSQSSVDLATYKLVQFNHLGF
jgi:hypothetical protein